MEPFNASSASPKVSPVQQKKQLRVHVVPEDNDLGPIGHRRRASQDDPFSPISPHTSEHDSTSLWVAGLQRQHEQEKANAVDRHNMTLVAVDELEMPHADGKLPSHCRKGHCHLRAVTALTIVAGPPGNQKKLDLPVGLLEQKSQYFKALFKNEGYIDHMVIDDVDPIAMGMWMRWVMVGTLEKPHDFHSLTHWFALYTISIRFDMEDLKNHVMDTIRHHYYQNKQTCSPFRVEYVYTFTEQGDYLRSFVMTTAVSRCIKTGKVSKTMRALLAKGGVIAGDFAQIAINYARDPTIDVLRTPDCAWHTHRFGGEECRTIRRTQVDGA